MWFQSYLSDRSQVFRANGKDSKTIRVNCTQGSVLGPMEFISYTGDVTDIFERHHIGHHLFADDKQCCKHHHKLTWLATVYELVLLMCVSGASLDACS